MTFSFKADSKNRKIELHIQNLETLTKRGIRQAFYKLGRDVKDTTSKNILKKPRSGRKEKFRGRNRRASVAGESFANRSGDARKQLGYDVHGSDELEVGFRSNAKTVYTKILEEKLNRPTLAIATSANNRNATVHFEREIQKMLKRL